MEKIMRYQKIIIDVLNEHAKVIPANLPGIEIQVISDPAHHHYQLVHLGWSGSQFIHSVLFHLDIKSDGKIWLQANYTDSLIADELVAKGVPKSDIVLGIQPPYARPYTGFAAA
jgi:hypothetical protein